LSLTGNLEDLPLIDIIQIVSFSKKTGYLTVVSEEREAAIIFSDGLVVSSFTWSSEPLDARAEGLDDDARAQRVRTRIEQALAELVRLREGQFSFSLTASVPATIGARNITGETLSGGINPQELLLDLARDMDEGRRDSSQAIEASFAHSPASVSVDTTVAASASDPVTPPPFPAPEPVAAPEPEQEPEPETVPRRLLLVDDEPDVRHILSLRFAEGGFNVEEAASPDEAVKAAARLGKSGLPFVLVSDLGMPTSGGASFHGGFEVVKRLWKMKLSPPVLLMTESLTPAVRARARQMGIEHIVLKPGLSKLDADQFEEDLKGFADDVIAEVLPEATKPARPRPTAADARPTAPAQEATAATAELAERFRSLHERLDDLGRRTDAAEIAQLVMSVAQEFFERGLLLLVKKGELRGLGGFGLAPKSGNMNLLAREITISLREPSPFYEVIRSRKPARAVPIEGRWCQHLAGKLGRFKSNQFGVLPLVTHGATMALLVGDNPETGRPFHHLEILELFLTQAGMALDKLFLQRKLQALET